MSRLWALQGCTIYCHDDHTFSWSLGGVDWRYLPDEGGGAVAWKLHGGRPQSEVKVPSIDAAVAFARGFVRAWGLSFPARGIRPNPEKGE